MEPKWLQVLLACFIQLTISSFHIEGKRDDRDRKSYERYEYEQLQNQRMSGGRIKYRRKQTGPAAHEQALLKHLFRDYDTDARGVVDPNTPVTVSLALLLLRIQGLDERSQVLTTTGLVITDWRDERLKWNPEDYGNVTDIVVNPRRVWLPELALMNGADELAPDFRKIRVLLSSDGAVHWEPGGIFETTCDIDIRYFPFDEQSCPIQFGAWAYYSQRMNMTNMTHEVIVDSEHSTGSQIVTHDFRLNGEWAIVRTKAEPKNTILPCCPDIQYSYVEFTLILRRRYTFYVMNIILPCTLLSVLVMIVFCLPPDAGEKITLGINALLAFSVFLLMVAENIPRTSLHYPIIGEKISLGISVLLAFTVFLLMVAENVPRTSLHIPIMVVYLTCTMALGTLSVCMTVLVLNFHHRDSERPVPKWAKVLIFTYLARILCVGARKPKTLAGKMSLIERKHHERDHNGVTVRHGLRQIAHDVGLLKPMLTPNGDLDMESNNANKITIGDQVYPVKDRKDRKQDNSTEWKEIAHVLDRFFFIIVLILMTCSCCVILLVPMYKVELHSDV